MKKTIFIIAILGVVSLGGIFLQKNWYNKQVKQIVDATSYTSSQSLHKVTFSIEGMWCASCAVGAQYSLKSLAGVIDAYVGFTEDLDGEGWVVYDPVKVTKKQIIKAVEPYKATIVSDIIYN